jgi:hypothetical protein
MKSFRGASSGPMVCYSVTVNVAPGALAANLGAYQDVAIPANPGCVAGQRVFMNPLADLSVLGYTLNDARVSATNVVRLQGINATAAPAAPAALDVAFIFVGQREQV